MGKGEIARYEQFLLFSQRFPKTCFPGASKGVVVWEWVKRLVQNEIIRRRQDDCISIDEICVVQDRKQWGKGRK